MVKASGITSGIIGRSAKTTNKARKSPSWISALFIGLSLWFCTISHYEDVAWLEQCLNLHFTGPKSSAWTTMHSSIIHSWWIWGFSIMHSSIITTTIIVNDNNNKHIYIYTWLVLDLPLWKILVNGKDCPIYYGKIKKCSKPPTRYVYNSNVRRRICEKCEWVKSLYPLWVFVVPTNFRIMGVS